jgi:3-methyladenine DNA glycosylase AlkC
MEPLKEMFNSIFIKELAFQLKKNYPLFDQTSFVQHFENNQFFDLSLNQRMRKITETMRVFLPDEFNQAVDILKNSISGVKPGYTTIIFPDYVGLYGKPHFNESMKALKYFTTFGTSEFAIREFLKHDFDATFKVMLNWATDKNVHVRRLASEGCRPRLPWSFKLDATISNPFLTSPVLQTLKNDNELYVKKSVANHLNDITKDNTEAFFKITHNWDLSNNHTNWIVKHAGRNLIKNGNSKMLALIGITAKANISNLNLNLKNNKINIGEYLSFQCSFISNCEQKIVIDYAIYYLKQNAIHTKKIFKLKTVEAKKGETIIVSKKQLMKIFSTRKLYPGIHYIEMIINGDSHSKTSFELH